MDLQWKSKKIYEHPVRCTYGNVVKSAVGVYGMLQGSCWMSVPQDWAAEIEYKEQVSEQGIINNNGL